MDALTTDLTSETEKDFDLWIEAGHIEKHYWLDLWRYRELLFMLAWRDVAVRYKQTVAGAAWALLQPFLNMLIMTVIFSRVAGLPSVGSAPYAIMVEAAGEESFGGTYSGTALSTERLRNCSASSGDLMLESSCMMRKINPNPSASELTTEVAKSFTAFDPAGTPGPAGLTT